MTHRYLLSAMLALTLPCVAMAATGPAAGTSIRNLPDRGTVTVSGTVEKVKNEREFTLRDNSGTIDVRLPSGDSTMLKTGEGVTVSGDVEKRLWGLMGKDIKAASVAPSHQTGSVSQNDIQSDAMAPHNDTTSNAGTTPGSSSNQ